MEIKEKIKEERREAKETIIMCVTIVCTIVAFFIFSCTRSYGSVIEPPTKEEAIVVKKFNEAQFMKSLEEPKEIIDMFFFIVDHSKLTVSIDSWNYFINRLPKYRVAYRAALQGWEINFDEI